MFYLYTKGKNMSEKFTVKDREELERLIRAMIDRDGPNCDLNFIDVSKVTDMHCLFLSSNFNGDISKWNVSNVTDMHAMFMSSSFNGEIGEWDMSNVSDMSEMFCKTIFNGDVNKWNISKGTDVTNAFTGSALDRNNNLPAWYKERITPKDSLKALINIALKHYNDCDLNFIDVSKITDMSELFKNSRYTAGVSRSGIERWNISNVTNMVGMLETLGNGSRSSRTKWIEPECSTMQKTLPKNMPKHLLHGAQTVMVLNGTTPIHWVI